MSANPDTIAVVINTVNEMLKSVSRASINLNGDSKELQFHRGQVHALGELQNKLHALVQIPTKPEPPKKEEPVQLDIEAIQKEAAEEAYKEHFRRHLDDKISYVAAKHAREVVKSMSESGELKKLVSPKIEKLVREAVEGTIEDEEYDVSSWVGEEMEQLLQKLVEEHIVGLNIRIGKDEANKDGG